jgi:hypothetical protein
MKYLDYKMQNRVQLRSFNLRRLRKMQQAAKFDPEIGRVNAPL